MIFFAILLLQLLYLGIIRFLVEINEPFLYVGWNNNERRYLTLYTHKIFRNIIIRFYSIMMGESMFMFFMELKQIKHLKNLKA